MIVSIHQPAYLPWLGYFERIARSDAHVVLDHVQFEKNSFVNRNRVLTASGPTWLTLPVRTKGRFGALPIHTVEIDNTTDWRRKHWSTIQQSYAHAPHFAEYAGFFQEIYEADWELLAPLCETITSYLLEALGIDTPRQFSTAMALSGGKSDLVLEICQAMGAKHYLSGALGRDYLAVERFESAGLQVTFQDYVHPVYPQRAVTFEPNLSVIDLLFNCGAESRAILRAKESEAVKP